MSCYWSKCPHPPVRNQKGHALSFRRRRRYGGGGDIEDDKIFARAALRCSSSSSTDKAGRSLSESLSFRRPRRNLLPRTNSSLTFPLSLVRLENDNPWRLA